MRLLPILIFCLLTWPQSSLAFCFEEAATEHNVPAELLWAIAKVESGFNPQARFQNSDGTIDFGVMQINSSWETHFSTSVWSALDNPCTNVQVGAEILSDCLKRNGYNWKGIGCYNAISPDKQANYARRILDVMRQMPGANQFSSSR